MVIRRDIIKILNDRPDASKLWSFMTDRKFEKSPNMKSKNDYENYNFSILQNDAKIISFLIRFN